MLRHEVSGGGVGALAVERRSPAPPDPSFLRVTEGDSTPRFDRQYNAASRFRHREIDMRENALKRLWAQDKPALGGWLTNPSSASAETFAHAGFQKQIFFTLGQHKYFSHLINGRR